MNVRTVDDYMLLPYTIEFIRDASDGGWVARVLELPGCITQADTFEQLDAMIQDAMRGWIEVALEDGLLIPEPRAEENYSGKFVVRVPKSLHRQLVRIAEEEGVSLNQYISMILANAVGHQPLGRIITLVTDGVNSDIDALAEQITAALVARGQSLESMLQVLREAREHYRAETGSRIDK